VTSGKNLAKVTVIKLGGSTLGNRDTVLEDLVTLQKAGTLLVVIHGGGDVVTDWLTRLQIPTSFIQGLRVTDAETLKVVIAILAGLVNKELVAAIEISGGQAMGFCGIDGGFLEAKVKNASLGYAGEVVKVDLAPLKAVLEAGFMPVIAPVSLEASPQSEETGFVLNVNGDVVAGEIAAALSAEKLIFITDVVGICDNSGNLIPKLSAQEAKALLESGVASGGMIPKIEACLSALRTVPITRIIDGRIPRALLDEMEGKGKGTTIYSASA
jgi:acetylglutamate kinase